MSTRAERKSINRIKYAALETARVERASHIVERLEVAFLAMSVEIPARMKAAGMAVVCRPLAIFNVLPYEHGGIMGSSSAQFIYVYHCGDYSRCVRTLAHELCHYYDGAQESNYAAAKKSGWEAYNEHAEERRARLIEKQY